MGEQVRFRALSLGDVVRDGGGARDLPAGVADG
jgi:hypothetical protein